MGSIPRVSIVFYDALHVIGALLTFTGLGGLAALALSGSYDNKAARVPFVMCHGIGLLILLVAGFGALAKLGVGFPPWVIVKLVLWLFLGASMTLFKRKAALAKTLVLVVIAAGVAAAYLGNFKPF